MQHPTTFLELLEEPNHHIVAGSMIARKRKTELKKLTKEEKPQRETLAERL